MNLPQQENREIQAVSCELMNETQSFLKSFTFSKDFPALSQSTISQHSYFRNVC